MIKAIFKRGTQSRNSTSETSYTRATSIPPHTNTVMVTSPYHTDWHNSPTNADIAYYQEYMTGHVLLILCICKLLHTRT
jgi:hypothetical protein